MTKHRKNALGAVLIVVAELVSYTVFRGEIRPGQRWIYERLWQLAPERPDQLPDRFK